MIKLKTIEQVEIHPHFQEFIKIYFEQKIRIGIRQTRYGSRTQSHDLDKLKFYRTDPGFQVFLTRMKQLDFASFTMIKALNKNWFKATTKELIVDMPKSYRNRVRTGKYNIGAYSIYYDFDSLIKSDIDKIHFIPEKQKLAKRNGAHGGRESIVHARHMHHKAYWYPNAHDQILGNPLTYQPATCWGNFGNIMSLTCAAGDIPELYRALYLYVTIQNPDSPLTPFEYMEHYERMDEE